jgi:hypothetical protein
MSDNITPKIQDALTQISAQVDVGLSLDQQYKQAKALLKQALIQSIKDAISDMTNEEIITYISFLYWHNRDDVGSKILAGIVGITHHQLRSWVEPATYLVRCRDCNQYFEHLLTSRADLDDCESTGLGICETCQNRRRQNDVSYEHYLASQRREVERLRSLPYSEYLKSEHWQEVRKSALKRARYRCQVCNKADSILNVHHRTYEHRGEEYAADVVVLCEDCHTVFHLNGKLSRE